MGSWHGCSLSCIDCPLPVHRIGGSSDTVARHARRYRDLVAEHWGETDWSEAQAGQMLARIDSVLEQLPEAKRQAHERILGGRQVAKGDKILSLYESDVHVVVRGKAGAAVEFGNSLLVAEQADGLIVDYELSRARPPTAAGCRRAWSECAG